MSLSKTIDLVNLRPWNFFLVAACMRSPQIYFPYFQIAIQPYVEQVDKPPGKRRFLTASTLSGSASLAIIATTDSLFASTIRFTQKLPP
jgi:hypothetical protein